MTILAKTFVIKFKISIHIYTIMKKTSEFVINIILCLAYGKFQYILMLYM